MRTKLEQARRANEAPSRAADSREFRVTTKDPAQGRQAAPRRRIPALSLFLPILALAFASPAFAATGLAADSADQLHASTPLSETVAGPMLPEQRSMLFANDVSMRSEEHTSELQSLMRNSYAVFCLKKTNKNNCTNAHTRTTIYTTSEHIDNTS